MSKLEFLEKYDKLYKQINDDYQKLKKFTSLEEISKKAREYDLDHTVAWRKLENYFVEHKLSGQINIENCQRELFPFRIKFKLIASQINQILKNQTCHQCKSPLSLNSIYHYSSDSSYLRDNQGKLKQWTLTNSQEFGSVTFDNFVLFCSEACFQNSNYSQVKPKKSEQKPTPRQATNSHNKETFPKTSDLWFCSSTKCPTFFEEKSGSYFYNTQTNDNKKLCSEECYLQEYGLYCSSCKQKFLTYHAEGSFAWCLPCWEKLEREKQEQKEKLAKLQKDLVEAMTKVASGESENNQKVSVVEGNNSKNNNINNKDMNIRERERERERAKSSDSIRNH